jgi:hypothetical protein
MNGKPVKSGWTVLFSLWMLQGLAASVLLIMLPSDRESQVIFGLSTAKLFLLSITLFFAFLSAVLLLRAYRQSEWPDLTYQPRHLDFALVAGLVIFFAALLVWVTLLGLSQGGLITSFAAYASRLAPVLGLFALASMELVAFIIWRRRYVLEPARPIMVGALWIWLALGVVMAFAALTGIGVRFEAIGVWSKPAIPFWEWQIALAWIAGSVLLLLERFDRFPRVRHPDRWIGLALWAGVAALWLSQPINLGWQAGPRAPNFEPYPFSDAENYANYAQSILIGNGIFHDAVPPRPLYVGFLALLHAIAGQEYARVIFLQSLVLALFPMTLYFLGKEISGRPLGIMLAILAATRDVMTGLSADFAGNFSYSKFYLSELPTALLLSAFTLFIIKGAKRPALWNPNFMLAGGFLGLAVLMRTQSLFILPPALLLAFLSNRANWKIWFAATATLTITMALTILPWLWRNYQNTGGLVMDDPSSQMSLRALWYHGVEDGIVEQLPGESSSEYSQRLVEISVAGIRENPGRTVRLTLSHFLNNQIGNILVFPVRDDLESPDELLRPTRAFWEQVELKFTPGRSAQLAAYLLVFSLGVAVAWRHAGWAGLIPLVINLSYNFSTAIFLSSGMRFLLPVDWGFYAYYALGLLALTHGLFLILESLRSRLPEKLTPEQHEFNPSNSHSWKPVLLGSLAFLLITSGLPLSERFVPQRYQPASRASLIQMMTSVVPTELQTEFAGILEEPGLVVFQGRALYPRYYAAAQGEPGTGKLGFAPMPQARLVFFVIGEENSRVIFNLVESPAFFPHAADIVLIARQESSYLQALAILVENNGRSRIYLASEE